MNIDKAYADTLDELYNDYAAFHKIGAGAYAPGLGTTLTLADALGNPHKRFKTIHVGGTNGKGSTAHTLAAVLQRAGYKVGLYTSPHILDFRERIRIDGEMIGKAEVVDFVGRLKGVQGQLHPSFFEATTLMAFDAFARAGVDIAVIEVGLGGRLDSTNIIEPLLSVITNISLDHTALLGDTEEAIAAEKAGIVKPGVPVVIGNAEGEVRKVFERRAAETDSEIFFAKEQNAYAEAIHSANGIEYRGTAWADIRGELCGDCQAENAATILTALRVLQGSLGPIPAAAVREGFAAVCALTGLAGRWMNVPGQGVKVLCDTGHNIGGWRYLAPGLERLAQNGALHVVLGFVNDKDVDAIMALLPRQAHYYFATPSVERARPAASTASIAAAHGIAGIAYDDVASAFTAARQAARSEDTIFVGGSTFVVADLLAFIGDR